MPALAGLDAAWRVRTLSDALRQASDLLGRSYLRMAAAVWDLRARSHPGGAWCRAVVVGVTAAVGRPLAAETARLVAFDDVQTVVAAALKLTPFDPSVGVPWAVAAAVEVERLVTRVADLDATGDIPAHSAPLSSSGASSTATAKGGSSVPDVTPAFPPRALRLGVAGPVGTGKSSLIALLCRELGSELSLAVVTNDIYTDEDARFLRSAGVLAPERIRAVETGACPHTAIRDDVTQNLLAVEDLERDFAPVDVVLVESAATTSPPPSRRRWSTPSSSSSTWPAAETSPARADRHRPRRRADRQQDRPGPLRRGRRRADGARRRARPGRAVR